MGSQTWHLQTVQGSETKASTEQKIWAAFGSSIPQPPLSLSSSPQIPSPGKSSVYRRENLFLKALIVLAIIGAISVKREIRLLFQIRSSSDIQNSALQPKPKSRQSWFCTTRKMDASGSCLLTPQHKQNRANPCCAPASPRTITISNSNNLTKTQRN